MVKPYFLVILCTLCGLCEVLWSANGFSSNLFMLHSTKRSFLGKGLFVELFSDLLGFLNIVVEEFFETSKPCPFWLENLNIGFQLDFMT